MMKRPVRIVRNLGATVDDVMQKPMSTPDPSEQTSQQIAQATVQQIAQVAQAANVPVAQVAQQVAQVANAVAQQNQSANAAPPQMQMVNSQTQMVYNSQDPNSPSEKSVSMMDYLIDNKWWVIIAVAVAYYAIKSED